MLSFGSVFTQGVLLCGLLSLGRGSRTVWFLAAPMVVCSVVLMPCSPGSAPGGERSADTKFFICNKDENYSAILPLSYPHSAEGVGLVKCGR